MPLWLVRAGRDGEYQDLALEQNVVTIGYPLLGDLGKTQSREALAILIAEKYPDWKPAKVQNGVGQVWAFRDRIQKADLVALPLKQIAAIAVGRVTGGYKHRPDFPEGAQHTRSVEWIRKDIPRSAFEQDILYSLGAFMTVCQIKRNNAEERVKAILEGKAQPPFAPIEQAEASDAAIVTDLEEYARDQIRDFIGTKFKGHALARLVSDILRAQGYQTEVSPPGPDGGVDIIAGRGSMGFDRPRLCVQVKSGSQPEDVKSLRELQGVMKNFGAEQGLFVSWSGFKHTVTQEARRHFFDLRLWDAGHVVNAVLAEYERLPEDLQAEVPLKRIWTVVREE